MVSTGTILEINDRKAYVFTADCRMIPLKAKREYFVGQQIQFTKNDYYKNNLLSSPEVFRTLLSIAAVFIIIVSSVLTLQLLTGNSSAVIDSRCTAVVSVDINPGIQISVNKDGLIIEVDAVNDDGRQLLSKLSLTGKPLKKGVDEVVAMAGLMGFITEKTNLVFVSAALSGGESDSSYASQLKGILSSLEEGYDNADVLTVFIEDSQIIEDAQANDLSIGKELLYKYARMQNLAMTPDQIRQTAIVEILNNLNALAQNGKLDESIIKQAEGTPVSSDTTSSQAAASSVASSAASAAPSQAAPSQTVSSQKSSSQGTQMPTINPQLSVTVDSSTLKFAWTPLSSGTVLCGGTQYTNFRFYKVVASLSNPNPVYPADGYLYVGSSMSGSSWSVDPSGGNYNQSPALVPGKTYYFSVTYVFENGKFTSNTVQAKIPEQAVSSVTSSAASSSQTASGTTEYVLSLSAKGTSLNFSWTPLSASAVTYKGVQYSGFRYYKVVASLTNPNPVYPEDGYLYVGSSLGSGSWTVDTAGGDYNQSPVLVGGKTYYFAVTYVFDSGKFSSNVVQAAIPASTVSAGTSTQQPVLSVSASGSTLLFNWTPLTASSVTYNGTTYTNFQYYKIVASLTNPNPVYPTDGYLFYNSTLSASSWSVDITKENYNLSPKLVGGKTYYFSVTYVFGNGKFTSNTVTLALPTV